MAGERFEVQINSGQRMTISIIDSMSFPNWRAVLDNAPWPPPVGPFELVVLDGPSKGMTAAAQLNGSMLLGERAFSW